MDDDDISRGLRVFSLEFWRIVALGLGILLLAALRKMTRASLRIGAALFSPLVDQPPSFWPRAQPLRR